MTVIRIVGLAIGGPSSLDGLYLSEYDADGRGGRGVIAGTSDRSRAKQFNNPGDAFAFWQQTSRVQPLRPDGLPNRPLTAYTIEVDDT